MLKSTALRVEVETLYQGFKTGAYGLPWGSRSGSSGPRAEVFTK